ncbi:MAG: hypothetical protein H0Z37_09375 [Firmicutes bacterium]|nr:hypothetical protein [Bacillota bacterium]
MATSVLAVGLLPLGLYIYETAVHRNLAYSVGPEGVTVEMGIGRIKIPAGELAGAGLVPETETFRRVGGSSLRGLQRGWFRQHDGTWVYRLTTAGRGLVYVDTTAGAQTARPATRYVFSPADPERFVALVQAIQSGRGTVSGGETAAVRMEPVPGPPVATDPVLLLAVAMTLPIGIVIPWRILRGPRILYYQVGPDGITVHERRGTLFRWESVRDVRVLDGPQSPFVRILGWGMPGYYVGTYYSRGLGRVRVVATRLKPPLVMLETESGRLVLSPADTDGFLEAVTSYRA